LDRSVRFTTHLPVVSGPTLVRVSDGAARRRDEADGAFDLAADLSPVQLDAAPVLHSIDDLLIDDLTDDEDDAFAAALES
jgi:hypothetical protein